MIPIIIIYFTLSILLAMGIQARQIKGIADESTYDTIDSISDFSLKGMFALVYLTLIVAIGHLLYVILTL